MGIVELPFRRRALRERDEIDRLDELRVSVAESASARVELALELSELTHEIGEAAGARWVFDPADDLAEKARLYSVPLKLAASPGLRSWSALSCAPWKP